MDTKNPLHGVSHKPENKNSAWIQTPGVWTTYVAIIIGVRMAFYSIGVETVSSWTMWHTLHNIVTIFL